MNRAALTLLASVTLTGVGFAAAPSEAVVQGFYEGACAGRQGDKRFEARVVALGHGAYHVFVRQPLGGGKVAKSGLEGKTEGDTVRFVGKGESAAWNASYADGTIKGTCGLGATLQMKRVVCHQSLATGVSP